MNLLFTGRGTSGSWKIRGEQLGAAMGASVRPMAAGPCDIVIGVKRLPDVLLKMLRGTPLIWDIVDSWPQPAGNDWTEDQCKRWLIAELARIRPVGVIAATDAMRRDVEALGVPALWLPHHHRPGIKPNPIRQRIEAVGYEGGRQYIEPLLQTIQLECHRIKAGFLVNPWHLADVDVVLALRGATGYAPRNWKSGVKLANAHGSGTPFIGCREAGYLEMATGCEYWADTQAELRIALDWLADQSAREQVSDRFRSAAFSVDAAAATLREWLEGLRL